MGAYTAAGMYPQTVFHADVRAREMELAAERQVGCSCSALGRMISRVITKCNGRDGRIISRYDEKMDYAMAYAPAQTCYVRPTARNVTLSVSDHHPAHAHAVQPEPPRAHATTLPGTPSFPSTGAPPHGGGAGARKPKKKKKKTQVRFTPSGPVPMEAPPPHAQHHTATAAGGGGATATAAGVVYHHGAAEPPPSHSPAPPVHGRQGGHGYAYGYGYGRYAPSPLPRWELLGTPRRPEYFSSEYRWYYPTPVREGIYSIATDANGRLSTIFSEENPNACTIV